MVRNRVAMMSVIVIVLLISIAISVVGFRIGFQSGVTHAISDSIFYIADYDGYTDPLGKEYDLRLIIDLDGDEYEQGLYVC